MDVINEFCQIVQAIKGGNLEAVESILKSGCHLVEVDEMTFATDNNIVNIAVTEHRLDIAKYLTENGFRKPLLAVNSS